MLQRADPDAESGRRAGDVFKAKHAPRAWLGEDVTCAPEYDEAPQIGEVTFLDAKAPSGRRLPLPVRK
jgi:hypothetical protein